MIPSSVLWPVPVADFVEQVLRERVVHGDDGVAQYALFRHRAQPDDARRGLLEYRLRCLPANPCAWCAAGGPGRRRQSIVICRLMVGRRRKMRVIRGYVVLALDRVHRNRIIAHQRRRHIVLRGQRIRRAQRDRLHPSRSAEAIQIGRLGGDVQAKPIPGCPASGCVLMNCLRIVCNTGMDWNAIPCAAFPCRRATCPSRHRPLVLFPLPFYSILYWATTSGAALALAQCSRLVVASHVSSARFPSEVAECSRLAVDRTAQIQMVDADALGRQLEVGAHQARDLVFVHGSGAERVHQDRNRVGHADCISQLHFMARRPARRRQCSSQCSAPCSRRTGPPSSDPCRRTPRRHVAGPCRRRCRR